MSQLPSITISTTDHDHIFSLIERLEKPNETVLALIEELYRANIVDIDELPTNIVRMHSNVSFVNEDSSAIYSIKLVFPKELDDTPGKVSIFSPAGAALLGLSVNDQIQWPLNSKKTLRIKVIGVE